MSKVKVAAIQMSYRGTKESMLKAIKKMLNFGEKFQKNLILF